MKKTIPDKIRLKEEKCNNGKCNNSDAKMIIAVLAVLVAVSVGLLYIIPQVNAADTPTCTLQTCSEDTECPTGQVCTGGCPDACAAACQPIENWPGLYAKHVCKPCATSAECVKKTFEKAIPGTGASAWFVIAIAACAIAFVAAGIVFMLGYAFDMRQVKQIGRAELMQAVASLILVGLLFGASWSEYSLIQMMETQTGMITAAIYEPEKYKAVTSGGGTIQINPFEVSYAYLRNLIACAEKQYRGVYDMSINYEWLANAQMQVTLKIPVLRYIPFIPMAGEFMRMGMIRQVQEKEYLGDELTWLTILLHMQLAIMRFVETSMFTVFLPIGIILRAFPPTRGAGAVMIAIAIGLYIVYPLVYTLLAVSSPPAADGCSVAISTTQKEIKKECPISSTALTSGITQAQSAASDFESSLVKVKSKTTQLRYLVYLYFIIALGAAFLFIRSISGILGADIGEIGRSMMKMM